VPGERLLRIMERFTASDQADGGAARLCDVCAEVVVMTGAGIMLMSGDTPRGSVCSSNEVSALIEELQFTLGEGPCVDAYDQDQPVLEPNLAEPATPRWSAFGPTAVAAGARAVFGFPMHVGVIRLGALNVYRDRPGPLTSDQHADALVMAGVAARAVLAMQADAPPGGLAAEIQAVFPSVVHQASGMVAAQLNIDVRDALIRLRAHAFATDRSLAAVAGEVVARRLRFD
jgi:hypothetical protein